MARRRQTKPAEFSFALNATPPFRLDLTAWALRRNPINRVDRWDGTAYARTMLVNARPVEVVVTQPGTPDAPRLVARVRGARASATVETAVTMALNRLLSLGVDLAPFYAAAAGEPRLSELAARFRGMKPPRYLSIFETLVNAICCQQISLVAGLTLLNRIAERFGRACRASQTVTYAFPRPRDLVGADLASLRALGLSRHKGLAVIDLAKRLHEKRLDLEDLQNVDDDMAFGRLEALRGIGRWSAEYALLRGLGRLNVFPADDVGARGHLEEWLRLRRPLDYDRAKRLLARWQPFAGLVYLHLLLKQLEETGAI
ncbi:MAG TPA: DNA-3-methyladenine glycosylase 2 family protein [Alphaproteobacteria bacterium]|nr:DNA-3-methyladenine glycosylase 2 family protein [Alphaproteobacteria bacterium]